MRTTSFLAIFIVIIVIISSVYFFGGKEKNIPFLPDTSEEKEQKTNQHPANDQQQKPSPSSGGGGESSGSNSEGSSGGSSSGEKSESNPQTCEERQISYSLSNFVKTEECNEFSGQTCIDKTAFCSIEVKNLDYEVGGTFTLEFTFFDITDKSTIQTTQVSDNIDPRETKTFKSTINVQSPDANKEISCSYLTSQIPTKTICN
jgi:hypothetical protein